MPSDARTLALPALEMLRGAIAEYQRRLAAAADHLRVLIDADSDAPAREREAAQLGEFAAGRIDAERFGALWEDDDALDQHDRALVRRAHEIVREIAGLPPERFIFDLPSGGRLTGVLGNAFADFGRAFGALMLAELVRTRTFDRDNLEMLHGFPRFRWTRAERAASPPLIVAVDGEDLWAGEIAQYLDGNQKIVLVVRPPAPPAALVRLITPGTLVLQSAKAESLAPLIDAAGPAVAALLPEGAAEFIHRPVAALPHECLTVSVAPAGPRKALEGWSVWQQQQEIDQLLRLAAPPPGPPVVNVTGAAAADPADRLAAWLLSHADAPPSAREAEAR